MACAPVTYVADARQRCAPFQLYSQSCDRKIRPGILPFTAQPAVHCSVTRTMSRVGLPGTSFEPYLARYVPKPPSMSSRLVTGDDHVACCTRWNLCAYPPLVPPAPVP